TGSAAEAGLRAVRTARFTVAQAASGRHRSRSGGRAGHRRRAGRAHRAGLEASRRQHVHLLSSLCPAGFSGAGARAQGRLNVPTILLVDDDLVIRREVSEILREEGFDVMAASGGAEALRLLASPPTPVVILLDLVMPRTDG